ncbi:MAG TPA: rhomboid family intramembrane serine protease [Candidatus Dormibacteraeota bacterium]|nr:rhomboid family intramembrane serine protease [Candidatus Dormibacteraeota bacterium]
MVTSYRYRHYRFNWRQWITPAIQTLLIANTAVLLVEILVREIGGSGAEYAVYSWLGLVPWDVVHGRLWQPFTYLFLHGGFWHLFWNMLFLWMFGCDLERQWGQRRFYIYYFVTGVGAGLVTVLVKMLMDPHGLGSAMIPTIGASGSVYGVILAAAVMFPDREVWLFPFPISIPMKFYAIIMGAIEFFGTVGATSDGVAHVTHLSAIFIGWLYLRRSSMLYRVRNRYSDWRVQHNRRRYQVYLRRHRDKPPSHPDDWVN